MKDTDNAKKATKNESDDLISKRKSEATSGETLADVENEEKQSDKTRSSGAPSPDGAFDEPKELEKSDPN